MADIHFADVYPEFEDLNPDVYTDTVNGKNVLIRSMESQLHSTRLFNENYFAFQAALDDAVRRGIKIIAMPGDFSDDGQPVHIKGLKKIMNHYAEEYNVSFFMVNGNHDPTRPFGKQSGERDFLSKHGRLQPIMSTKGLYTSSTIAEEPTVIAKEIAEWGYKEILEELKAYGFFPQQKFRYWETPFSTYDYEDYTFKKAELASKLDNRISSSATLKTIPDVSYLVEPVEGVWLLAIDANVYTPKSDGKGFNGSGIGYNEVLTYKRYLLEWTEKVVENANRLGKTLIAFSHYPMVDFNDGATDDMKQLFGVNSFQAHRVPDEVVGEIFADMGLKVHVGGHMHLNDTGIITTKNGNTLTNIQTPSLAAYPPAYKLMTIKNTSKLEVETVVLDSVASFNSFFENYKKEHDFLRDNFPDRMWNDIILASSNYLDFTNIHLQELVRWRLLPNNWPEHLKKSLLNKSGWQLVQKVLGEDFSEKELLLKMNNAGVSETDFKNWSGGDLILDFYRLRNADGIALIDIEPNRLKTYSFLFDVLQRQTGNEDILSLQLFALIFQKQMNGEESMKFKVHLE
ncbi:Calcineurin-like phosphoesterase [Maribacter dokdonensis DSW-8]|nr:Calcineurin-like phosphoesterase [Maribacter dokdonensis DSW-8]